MNSRIKGMVAWHNGTAVLLTGETEEKYGAEWYFGTILAGYRKGETLIVKADATLDSYENVKPMIDAENAQYDAFVAAE